MASLSQRGQKPCWIGATGQHVDPAAAFAAVGQKHGDGARARSIASRRDRMAAGFTMGGKGILRS